MISTSPPRAAGIHEFEKFRHELAYGISYVFILTRELREFPQPGVDRNYIGTFIGTLSVRCRYVIGTLSHLDRNGPIYELWSAPDSAPLLLANA